MSCWVCVFSFLCLLLAKWTVIICQGWEISVPVGHGQWQGQRWSTVTTCRSGQVTKPLSEPSPLGPGSALTAPLSYLKATGNAPGVFWLMLAHQDAQMVDGSGLRSCRSPSKTEMLQGEPQLHGVHPGNWFIAGNELPFVESELCLGLLLGFSLH